MGTVFQARLRALPFALKEGWRYLRATVRREPDRREAALAFARRTAKAGDPDSVLAALDRFAREDRFLMNVGPEKGLLLDEELAKIGPNARVLELGSFVGYSAILMARRLSDGEASSRSTSVPRPPPSRGRWRTSPAWGIGSSS